MLIFLKSSTCQKLNLYFYYEFENLHTMKKFIKLSIVFSFVFLLFNPSISNAQYWPTKLPKLYKALRSYRPAQTFTRTVYRPAKIIKYSKAPALTYKVAKKLPNKKLITTSRSGRNHNTQSASQIKLKKKNLLKKKKLAIQSSKKSFKNPKSQKRKHATKQKVSPKKTKTPLKKNLKKTEKRKYIPEQKKYPKTTFVSNKRTLRKNDKYLLAAVVAKNKKVAAQTKKVYSKGKKVVKEVKKAIEEKKKNSDSETANISKKALKHNFKYANRVRVRAVQDPVSHNFPYTFDDNILATKPILKNNGYKIFQKAGTMNSKKGVFEIGLTKDGIINHRFFRPRK